MPKVLQPNSDDQWKPIEGIPENWQKLILPDLTSLASVWAEQYDKLKQSQAVIEFNQRLCREWAIETGILEGIYTIDRGITQLLIEQGIDAALIPHGASDHPAGEVARIVQDHRDALEGLFDFVANRRPLTTSYIRELHQEITRNQGYVEALDQFGKLVNMPLNKGRWKNRPNNPTRPDGSVHQYCPPMQVANEMEQLIKHYNDNLDVAPEVLAAWLHHRFTQIHPFEDGNGRVARALATIVFLRAMWFPLVINRDQRATYISALESADDGDLLPLVRLFGQNAKHALVRALTLSEDILRGEKNLARVIDSLVELFSSKQQAVQEAYYDVEFVADKLVEKAEELLNDTALQIRQKFSIVDSSPTATVITSNQTNQYYYTAQIIAAARDIGYWANINLRRDWVRLFIVDGQKTHIVFSFHYVGKTNRGVMVCSAFVYFPESKPGIPDDESTVSENALEFGETHRIIQEPFYFSYKDKTRLGNLMSDFSTWVGEALTVGLAEWGKRF